jgi:predicted ArsR family transcriptional regulator
VISDRHTDPPFSGRVSARRGAVLDALRAAGSDASAEQIAEAAGVHVNTARFHLKRLIEDGLVESSTVPSGGRGRPQVLFRPRGQAGDRSYLMLAQMLSDVAATLKPGPVATVGRAWGERMLAASRADGDAVDRVEAVMNAIGFQPAVTRHEDGVDIELRHCPFVEVARVHPGVVCGMHQSLVQGVLDGLDSGLHVDTLAPFVTPTTCRAELRPAG